MATKVPLDDTYCVCESCQLSPSADQGMVACDRCNKWFHYHCAGVDDSIRNHPWSCGKCRTSPMVGMRPISHRAGSATSSLFRRKALELELKKLDEEKTLQEEYMRKRYEVLAAHLQEESEAASSARSSRSSGSRTRSWIEHQREFTKAKREDAPNARCLGAVPKGRLSNVEELGKYASTPLCHPDLQKQQDKQHEQPPVLLGLPGPSPIPQRPVPCQQSRLAIRNNEMPESQQLINASSEQSVAYTSTLLTNRAWSPFSYEPTLVNAHGLGPSQNQLAARHIW